jgi:hypothetical protein
MNNDNQIFNFATLKIKQKRLNLQTKKKTKRETLNIMIK